MSDWSADVCTADLTRTKGVELALTGRITPNWQVSSGYTYQDAQLRGNGVVRLAQVPKHQFALWNRYDFNSSVGAGIGVIHQSSQFAAIRTSATTTRLPAFTRVDAALFFKANERIEFQVNVENLLDEKIGRASCRERVCQDGEISVVA